MPKIKPFITQGVENVIPVLEAINSASDVFPPLKAVVSGALFIFQAVEEYNSNQRDWKAFADYVTQAIACVSASVSGPGQISHFDVALKDLEVTLAEIVSTIGSIPELKAEVKWYNKPAQYQSFLKDRKKIPDLEAKLDRALKNFSLGASVDSHNGLLTMLSNINTLVAGVKDLKEQVHDLEQEQQKADVNSVVHRLRCAHHSSLDAQKACHDGTRTELLALLEAFASATDPSSPERVLLLTGVAGCGKTAIAQSAAKLFDQPDWTYPRLGACFNFSAQVEKRRTPKLLFSTIAFSLSALDPQLKASIANALSDRPVLTSTASFSDQFHELVEAPLRAFSTSTRRIVIVIDGLDEIDKRDLDPLLTLLEDDFSRLPSSCRVILTSRPDHDILPRLEYTEKRHVVLQKIKLDDPATLRDIRVVARSRLRQIAKRRPSLGAAWPGPELEERLIQKAGGLFVWLDVVCKAVERHLRPTEELQRLLSGESTASDMNLLYQRILDACWDKEGFEYGYHLVVGAIIALKTPLSASGIQQLLGDLLGDMPVELISEPLASGVLDIIAPTPPSFPDLRLRISHESFRGFATRKDTPRVLAGQKRYLIDEVGSSQRLALRCLMIINDELPRHTELLTTLFPDAEGGGDILPLADGVVSEVLGYACDNWIGHLSAVTEPETGLLDALRYFLRNNVVFWIQLCAVKGHFHGIDILRRWLAQHDLTLEVEMNRDKVSRCLDQLSERLRSMHRLEEAVDASHLWVEIERQPNEEDSAIANPTLTKALFHLSLCLADFEQREDALIIGRQAVAAGRQLGSPLPPDAAPYLVMSLVNLSRRLWDLGHWEEALGTVEEAVDMYRLLHADQPALFASQLSDCLHSLSVCHQAVDRWDEALGVDTEAVDIRRHLAISQPAAFNLHLAASLFSLSIDLSNLGRPDEALPVIQESVDIRRQLASERPDVFNVDVAASLHLMSIYLSQLGREEEALSVAEEGVKIHRQLAAGNIGVHSDSDLARSLHDLSIDLSNMGHRERALSASREAVSLYRQLAADMPAVYGSESGNALKRLAQCLVDVGMDDEAAAVREELGALS